MFRTLSTGMLPFALLLAVACDEQETRDPVRGGMRDPVGLAEAPQDPAAAARDDHAHPAGAAAEVRDAVCVMQPVGGSGVEGVVTFHAGDGGITIRGRLTGLTPGLHGFHVHEFGDLRDLEKGESAGSHFAPHESEHGRPEDEQRHVGDLGNIEADESGVAEIEITDSVVSLQGPDSILGRSLVVHEREDDFSQPVGNAGGRVALGVIGVAKPGSNEQTGR